MRIELEFDTSADGGDFRLKQALCTTNEHTGGGIADSIIYAIEGRDYTDNNITYHQTKHGWIKITKVKE